MSGRKMKVEVDKAPIIPEELPTGLPIWLLYEATKQDGTCPEVTIRDLPGSNSFSIVIPGDVKPADDTVQPTVWSGCAIFKPASEGSQLGLGAMAAIPIDSTVMVLIAGLGNPNALSDPPSRLIEIGTATTDGQSKLQNMGAGYSGDCREIIGDGNLIEGSSVANFYPNTEDTVFCARLKAVNGNEILIRANWGQAIQSFTAARINWVDNN